MLHVATHSKPLAKRSLYLTEPYTADLTRHDRSPNVTLKSLRYPFGPMMMMMMRGVHNNLLLLCNYDLYVHSCTSDRLCVQGLESQSHEAKRC